jgi:hypothetical protein
MSWEGVENGLRELSAEMGGPPPELEARVLERFRARRRKHTRVRWAWAAAAALAIGIGLGAWLAQLPEPAAEARGAPSGFLLLDYGRPTRELTAGRLVRVTLPPTAPEWFGLPSDPAAREGIEAEILLGDDGVAQAVRFVE